MMLLMVVVAPTGMTDCISWGSACPDQSMEEDVEITHSSWTMVKSALSVVMSRCR